MRITEAEAASIKQRFESAEAAIGKIHLVMGDLCRALAATRHFNSHTAAAIHVITMYTESTSILLREIAEGAGITRSGE